MRIKKGIPYTVQLIAFFFLLSACTNGDNIQSNNKQTVVATLCLDQDSALFSIGGGDAFIEAAYALLAKNGIAMNSASIAMPLISNRSYKKENVASCDVVAVTAELERVALADYRTYINHLTTLDVTNEFNPFKEEIGYIYIKNSIVVNQQEAIPFIINITLPIIESTVWVLTEGEHEVKSMLFETDNRLSLRIGEEESKSTTYTRERQHIYINRDEAQESHFYFDVNSKRIRVLKYQGIELPTDQHIFFSRKQM